MFSTKLDRMLKIRNRFLEPACRGLVLRSFPYLYSYMGSKQIVPQLVPTVSTSGPVSQQLAI